MFSVLRTVRLFTALKILHRGATPKARGTHFGLQFRVLTAQDLPFPSLSPDCQEPKS